MRAFIALITLALAGCSDGGGVGDDTATDQPADTQDVTGETPADTVADDSSVEVECTSDGDCDDADPCTVDTCDLDYDSCSHSSTDADEDGYPAEEVGGTACSGGTDCDDDNPLAHPDATLDCDGGGDFDCDGSPDADEDLDGFLTRDCGGGDCDDADETAFPGSLAVDCSGADHDCNDHPDADNDGDGDDRLDCTGGGDCSDADPAISSLQDEGNCDGVDTDCDGEMSLYEDRDQDGYANETCAATGLPVDCDDDAGDVYPVAPEGCEATIDNDCDGDATEIDTDADGDGWGPPSCGGTDCDDTDASTYPGAPDDACDLVDRDCNGETDEHIDDDGDGWIDEACTGFLTDHGSYLGFGDCNDEEFTVNPGVTSPDACDGVDMNCDGEDADPGVCSDGNPCNIETCTAIGCQSALVDADGDGYDAASVGGTSCPGDDCDDADASIHPGAPELCPDAIDQNCDGTAGCASFQACGTGGVCENVLMWVTIPAGDFTMGSSTGEAGHSPNETQHPVTLTHAFIMSASEVTQKQFSDLMGYNPSWFSSCGNDCPVEKVDWHEAAAYCNALSAADGLEQCYSCSGSGSSVACALDASFPTPWDCAGYRLPTEAEWEYAARAGTTTATYNGDLDPAHLMCELPNAVMEPIAWFCSIGGATTHPDGLKTPNAWGLYDTLGNVTEWCEDWYVFDLGTGLQVDPWGPPTGTTKVTRGGTYDNGARFDRAASRIGYAPDGVGNFIGFRVVKTQ